MFGTFRERVSRCEDIKCLRGFRYDVQRGARARWGTHGNIK